MGRRANKRQPARPAPAAQACPLCHGFHSALYCQDKQRDYLQCQRCLLVYVPRQQRLPLSAEKAEYDKHQNDPSDTDYRHFLDRLFEPMGQRLSSGAEGLDFGSGPGPTLSLMFTEAGFPTTIYDPLYADHPERLQRQYDFISSTEVAEHLYQPGMELARLIRQLKPGGWLGLMTKRVIDTDAFRHWHYKNDPTHVCFFTPTSLSWLAQRHGCELELIGADVALLRKP